MDWQDTADEAAFRAQVATFVRERFPRDYRPDPLAEHSVEPEDVWGYNWPVDRVSEDPERRDGARQWASALAEKGWIAPGWPVEFGGAGLSAAHEAILQEEFMRAGVPTVNGNGALLLGPTLLRHGNRAQWEAHLPGIASGEVVWAQGFSEPEAGSDLAGVRTTAVRDGDHYIVNGQKIWTSLGQYADWLFLLVRTDPAAPKHKGLSFLLVDATTPGITIRPITDIRGAAPFAEIFFDDVRVPAGNLVGDENGGWAVAMTALNLERAGIGAVVKFDRAVHGLIAHVRDGAGTGYLRADQTRLRQEITRRHVEVRVLHNLARLTISTGGSGYEASVNQLFSAELHQRLARTGHDALGSAGQIWRSPTAPDASRFTHMRFDAVAATFLGGSTEIQRTIIATRGLGLTR